MLYEQLINRESMRIYFKNANQETNKNDPQSILVRVISGVIRTCLTQRQREITLLYYAQGLTMEQIADQLHINKSTVSRHLASVRKKMKEVLTCLEG